MDFLKVALKIFEGSRPDTSSECILWDGAQNSKGYGYVRIPPGELTEHPRMARVHRIAYWIFRGPFDLDLTIDHRCGERLCINPYHLEPETHEDNSRDGSLRRWNAEEYLDDGFI